MKGKITILFLTSDPTDASRLRLQEEFREIQQKLQLAKLRDNFELVQRTAVRSRDITQAVLDVDPQVVHFSGHGTESGELCVENEQGTSHRLSTEALSSLFELVGNQVHCVVLNACYSEMQGRAISEHIDYVIGMKQAIGDRSAIDFSIGFYGALAAGRSVEDSYRFGILELKMQNASDRTTPVLLKRSVNVTRPIENDSRALLAETVRMNHLCDNAYRYLIEDQIDQSGGWGLSQIPIMEEASGRSLSKLEKEEGGIISTFLALRGLRKYENNPHTFRGKPYAKKALQYFLKRQIHHDGSFGRYVESRSGIEIHPSIRHTAFAVSSLVDLDGPPSSTLKGLGYLKRNWKIEGILDDASPATAIVSLIRAVDKVISTPMYVSYFSDEERKELRLAEWSKVAKNLLRELLEMSKSSSNAPFWPPYGGNSLLLFETTIVIIDLIANPLPKILIPTVTDVISSMIDCLTSNGVPFNPETRVPDVGMSSYLLSLLYKQGFMENFDTHNAARFVRLREDLLGFVLNSFDDVHFRRYTHCDTIASLLSLKPYIRRDF